MKRILAPCLGVLLLVSCSKDVKLSSTSSPDRQSASELSSGTLSVTGGGTTVEGGKISTFVFNAVTIKKDGSVSGHLVYNIRTSGISNQVDIDCLTIDGNRARMSGTCTKIWGSGEVPWWMTVGSRVSFIIEDNGQGNSTSPDKISDLLFYIGIPPTGCANVNAYNTYLPISGNIEIH